MVSIVQKKRERREREREREREYDPSLKLQGDTILLLETPTFVSLELHYS